MTDTSLGGKIGSWGVSLFGSYSSIIVMLSSFGDVGGGGEGGGVKIGLSSVAFFTNRT